MQPQVRPRVSAILRRADAAWDVESRKFNAADCTYGVYRHKRYEHTWTARANGFIFPTTGWQLNTHVFACACNDDTGVTPLPVDAVVPLPAPSSSSSSSSPSPSFRLASALSAPHSGTTR